MIDSILFATTATPSCEYAARYAFELARKNNAKLHIFHVFGSPSHGYSQFVIDQQTGEKETYTQAYKEQVTAQIQSLYAEFFSGHSKVEIECQIGSTDTEILRKEKAVSADVMILGAHNKINDPEAVRYRNVTGGTLQKVARGARCPVIIIGRPFDDAIWKLKDILFCADLSSASMPAFNFALSFAKDNQSRLHILRVVDLSEHLLGRIAPQSEIELAVDQARAQMKTLYIPALEGFTDYEMTVWEGITSIEILKYIRKKKIELVTMARHSRPLIQKLNILGSTTEMISLRARCPVVSVNQKSSS